MNRDTWCLKSTLCSPSATSARKASNHDCSARIYFWIPYSSFILHHSSFTTDICHSPFLILLRQSSVISGILLRLLSHQSPSSSVVSRQLSILVSSITDNVKININIQYQYRYNAYSLYMTTMTITTKIKDKQIKKEQSAAKKQHTHTQKWNAKTKWISSNPMPLIFDEGRSLSPSPLVPPWQRLQHGKPPVYLQGRRWRRWWWRPCRIPSWHIHPRPLNDWWVFLVEIVYLV